jgi:hypothetical protein
MQEQPLVVGFDPNKALRSQCEHFDYILVFWYLENMLVLFPNHQIEFNKVLWPLVSYFYKTRTGFSFFMFLVVYFFWGGV